MNYPYDQIRSRYDQLLNGGWSGQTAVLICRLEGATLGQLSVAIDTPKRSPEKIAVAVNRSRKTELGKRLAELYARGGQAPIRAPRQRTDDLWVARSRQLGTPRTVHQVRGRAESLLEGGWSERMTALICKLEGATYGQIAVAMDKAQIKQVNTMVWSARNTGVGRKIIELYSSGQQAPTKAPPSYRRLIGNAE